LFCKNRSVEWATGDPSTISYADGQQLARSFTEDLFEFDLDRPGAARA
jgi:hypothetical protein